MHRGAVVLATDDGVDPVGELCHRSEGVWVEAGATTSTDEGIDALNQPVADQGPPRVPLRTQTGSEGWPSRVLAAAQAGAGGGGTQGGDRGGDRGTRVRTKQMPACRRGTSVHTLERGHRVVTTVTLSSCRMLGGGWVVPSWPQPMARHCTPLPTPSFWAGSLATRTLALMVADPLSCGGWNRERHRGWWAMTFPSPGLSFPICLVGAAAVVQSISGHVFI